MRDHSALTWRKSSYSGTQTNCVEVAWHKSSHSAAQTNCVEVGWHKSSHSGEQTNCVEVARAAEAVAVRDSKNASGPTLTFPDNNWRTFLHG